jgi:hypothetical protein
LDGLTRLIKEENALSGIDIVYFLLLPVTLFVVSNLPHATISEFWFFGLIFPGAIFSLPFGIYGKMVDSIKARIQAWSIFILYSTVVYALIASVAIDRWLNPGSKYFSLWPLSNLCISLGAWFIGLGIGSICMKWVFSVFERRLPSRREELARTKGVSLVKILLVGCPPPGDLFGVDLGLLLLLAGLIIHAFGHSFGL